MNQPSRRGINKTICQRPIHPCDRKRLFERCAPGLSRSIDQKLDHRRWSDQIAARKAGTIQQKEFFALETSFQQKLPQRCAPAFKGPITSVEPSHKPQSQFSMKVLAR